MKKLKTKILNLLLVSALGTAALGGAMLGRNHVQASALSAPSGVFTATSSASVGAYEKDKTQTAFVFPDGGKVSFRRDLALKWFAGENQAKYLTLTFSLKDFSFETLTFTFETATAISSDDDKSTNTVTFKADGSVEVNGEKATGVTVAADTDITLTLSEEGIAKDGEYAVLLNGEAIGKFVNVGGNFADYKNSVLTPLTIQAKLPAGSNEEARTTVVFKDLNGQKFTLDENGKIAEDTARPVLILNEDLTGLTLGTKFDVDYTKIDVLDDSLQTKITYYQYNPGENETNWLEMKDDTTFSDTVYNDTTVLDEFGKEYVAIRIEIEDDKYNNENENAEEKAAVYDFAWYAEGTEKIAGYDFAFIPLTQNDVGPTLSDNFDIEAYQSEVESRAFKKSASESAKLNLPSVEGMFKDDDTKYKGFKYTVYYKSKSSPNGNSSTANYNTLTIPVEKEGEYEFKIVAADKSGNPMTALDENKEEVEVTGQNVWELDSVPSFTFKIKSAALTVEEGKVSTRSATGIIDVKFSVSDFDVKGPSGFGEQYALFYFDMGAFTSKYSTPEYNVHIDASVLASIRFADLIADAFNPADVEDVAELYAKIYAQLLVETEQFKDKGITADDLIKADENGNAILRQIGEKKSTVSESVYPDNQYEWDATEKTFNPAEEGIYIVFGIFTHPEQAGNTVGAYHVIDVSATEDIIAGESQWLKNNLASIVLFAIAAALLVIIIILLLVKPSDETLEDVVKAKKKQNEKKE